jgi:hypothetical protein
VFIALRDRAQTDFCDSCHRPITCVDCHTAVGNEAVRNGLMLWDEDGPVRGPSGIAPGAPHATVRSEYLSSSDLCGTCHDVAGPAGFSESTYTHWSMSPAAQRNLTCSDCHDTHRRAVRYGEGVRLSLADGTLTIDHTEGGHHFPDGASFLRDVDVVVFGGGDELRRIPLAAELLRDEAPVVLPTDADQVMLRGVEAGATRIETEPGAERACVEVRRIRPPLLDALQLEDGSEVQTFGCTEPVR